MCTLCLCDMGELRDEWLRPPVVASAVTAVAQAAPPLVRAEARAPRPLPVPRRDAWLPPPAACLPEAAHA